MPSLPPLGGRGEAAALVERRSVASVKLGEDCGRGSAKGESAAASASLDHTSERLARAGEGCVQLASPVAEFLQYRSPLDRDTCSVHSGEGELPVAALGDEGAVALKFAGERELATALLEREAPRRKGLLVTNESRSSPNTGRCVSPVASPPLAGEAAALAGRRGEEVAFKLGEGRGRGSTKGERVATFAPLDGTSVKAARAGGVQLDLPVAV